MKYRFSKELVDNFFVEGHGNLNQCRIYKVFDNQNLIGQFFYRSELCFFSYYTKHIYVEIESNFFKKSKYILIDKQTQVRVGEYKISKWSGLIGKLILDGQKSYRCDILNSYSIFNRETRGRYDVQVSNGVNAVVYRLKIDFPIISTLGTRFRPFSGEIELWGEDIQLVFAGLFLLERVFENEDSSFQ